MTKFYEFALIGWRDIERIGHYPQISKFRNDYDKNEENSIYWTKYNVFPNFTPNLDNLIISEKAILTDALSIFHSGRYPFINHKLKIILEKFEIPIHEFYKGSLEYKGEYFSYWWFYYISNGIKYIDFKRSWFFIEKFPNNNKPFQVENIGELIKCWKKTVPGAEVLRLSEAVVLDNILQLDFFDFGFLSQKKYVSSKLAKELIRNSVTGIDLKAINYLELSKI